MATGDTGDCLDFDAFRAFCDRLEAAGFARLSPRWGITKSALMRGVGRPEREINGSDTDSRAKLYHRADGEALWDVTLYSRDGADGIPYFSDDFLLASPAVVDLGKEIEAWLEDNRDAYDLFVPIRWSSAPGRAREALDWFIAHESRLMTSPLADMYADLRRTLEAAVAQPTD